MSESKRPLLTFGVCSYNQEQFIREAVEAAFAQTYSPLQIILSDDCSKDRTFEIMKEAAAAYRGPHQVVLNRNPVNIGIARHVNKIVELTKGEFMVIAAGDDISLPTRTEVIWKTWENSGRRAMGIQTGFIDIDEHGAPLGNATDRTEANTTHSGEVKPTIESYVRTLQPGTLGCAFSYSPLVFSTFGPLPEKLIHEDNVVLLRALCLGSIFFINDPVVKRRFHGNNLFSRRHEVVATREAVDRQEDRMKRDAQNRAEMYRIFLDDMREARKRELITEAQWREVENECNRRLRLFVNQAEFMDASLGRKFQILSQVRKEKADKSLISWMLPRLLPRGLFRTLKTAGNSARIAMKQPEKRAAA